MSQKVNRNLSPQRNFSINTTFENILHKEVHHAATLKPSQRRNLGEEHVETSHLSRVGVFLVAHSRHHCPCRLFRLLTQAVWGLRRPVRVAEVQIRQYLGKKSAISFC